MIDKWNNLLLIKPIQKITSRPPVEDPDCTPYTIIKGPYLQTAWGQGCGYNSELAVLNCNVPCGKAYTGCVATSMAQIMRYHQYPSNFSWNSMLNNEGNYPIALLMKDIGKNVGMDYKCDGSSANTESKVANAFKNNYGYSSANYADYNYQTVKTELDLGRPVILRGGRNTGWWIFNQYSDGHAWVCDGYMSCTDPCWGSMLQLHMNWGWDGSYNGYFSFNNFNPANYTFNYKTGMVYNIKP